MCQFKGGGDLARKSGGVFEMWVHTPMHTMKWLYISSFFFLLKNVYKQVIYIYI